MNQARQKQVGYLEATAIGIGGMVGGGIFAVLGLSVELAQAGRRSPSWSRASSRW